MFIDKLGEIEIVQQTKVARNRSLSMTVYFGTTGIFYGFLWTNYCYSNYSKQQYLWDKQTFELVYIYHFWSSRYKFSNHKKSLHYIYIYIYIYIYRKLIQFQWLTIWTNTLAWLIVVKELLQKRRLNVNTTSTGKHFLIISKNSFNRCVKHLLANWQTKRIL